MSTSRSSVFLLLSFNLFLTITMASVVSLVCNHWEFNALSKGVPKLGSEANSYLIAQNVLGISTVRVNNPEIINNQPESQVVKEISVNEDNSYLVDVAMSDNQAGITQKGNVVKGKLSLIETTSSSIVNTMDLKSITGINIDISSEGYKCRALLSFDNGKTWVTRENGAWINSHSDSINNFEGMDIETLQSLVAADFESMNGFSPGITEGIKVKLLLYTTTSQNVEVKIIIQGEGIINSNRNVTS